LLNVAFICTMARTIFFLAFFFAFFAITFLLLCHYREQPNS
jgi:preprotein translocase subunit SecG